MKVEHEIGEIEIKWVCSDGCLGLYWVEGRTML